MTRAIVYERRPLHPPAVPAPDLVNPIPFSHRDLFAKPDVAT
jgi:hypothetical protein